MPAPDTIAEIITAIDTLYDASVTASDEAAQASCLGAMAVALMAKATIKSTTLLG